VPAEDHLAFLADLRAEALATDERRAVVLAGAPERAREAATRALEVAAIDPAGAVYVGSAEYPHCERVEPAGASELLGTTHDAVLLDCHDECRPNAIGRLAGTVDGGGLLVFLTPPLEDWPDRRDEFDASLAVSPFDLSDVAGNFRRRLVSTLRAHRGIAVVDVDSGAAKKEGMLDPPYRRPRPEPTPPTNHEFPRAAYESCLTADQVDALAGFERLRADGEALVVEADRGRGKSSAAGLAAASLACEGRDVLVTAPTYRSAGELFERAAELLETLDVPVDHDGADPRRLETRDGQVRYRRPADAAALPGDPDRVIVDEAAALPVGLLAGFLDAGSVAFTTTVHGYEGAGRGFSVRFRDRLAESPLTVTERHLAEPIRYAPGDPVEVWSFRALALDARPPVEQLVAGATPGSVTYRELAPADLLANEGLLREVFGLLVLAHYRTEPDDLARLLDAPNVSVHALLADGHAVSVALVAREGGLAPDTRAGMYEGDRVKGNMLPDVLTSQLRDEAAGELVGHRVMRLATHGAVRSRGLGSRLVAEVRSRCPGDWLGVGFGATPELVRFWDRNGFATVHVATSRNDRSGEHSVLMLDPLTPAGRELLDRHAEWFLRRVPATFPDALSELDPDVVRAVLAAADGAPPLALSDFEWRVAAGLAHGAAVYETAPRPARRLCLRHLVAPERDVLSAREERLLVRRTLQGRSWDAVTREFGFHARAECLRAVSGAVDALVGLYGDEEIVTERERFGRE